MTTILECSNLSKSYGRTDAVSQLSLKLDAHKIYGLLGPNGAGKTTLLNMIYGNIFPDDGEIRIEGVPLKQGQTPTNVCYVKEKNPFFRGARVYEIMEFASAYYPNWDWDLAKDLLKAFQLNANKKIGQLSRGMESLVNNVAGLASRAPLTIFDEPVLGLDVLMRERFYTALMEDYAQHPRTILLSTHLIDEIANVVEQVSIMHAGSIVLQDDVDAIRSRSHLLRGTNDALAKVTEGKRVIYREAFGSSTFVALFDDLNEEELSQADRLGISVDPLPLQKFFAYFVEGGSPRE